MTDYVKCIDGYDEDHFLITGNIYELIEEVYDDNFGFIFYTLKDLSGYEESGWSKARFIDAEKQSQDIIPSHLQQFFSIGSFWVCSEPGIYSGSLVQINKPREIAGNDYYPVTFEDGSSSIFTAEEVIEGFNPVSIGESDG